MSCSKWKEVSLGNIINFNPRENIPINQIAKKIPMETLAPFSKYITSYTLTNFNGGTKFRNGDTLFARITPCLENGKTSQVTILDEDEVGFGSTEYLVLREKPQITDKDFIYYLFVTPHIRNIAIKSMVGSSGRQRVQLDVLKSINIFLPPISEQKEIAATLSCLDDKIELNNRINKNLEEMAQAIFKRWFVDFEFPDENGNPYKSSGGEMVESELGDIPKGWQIKGLDNIASYLNGLAMQKYRPETNDFLRVIKIKELGQECTDENSDKASANISEEYIIHNGDVIFSWSGTLLIKIWTGGTGALNQHLFKVSSTVYDKWFYYLWTLKYLEDFKSIAKDKATTMGHIKRIHLTNSKVLVPNNSELNMMNDIMNPIIDHMTGIKIQNQTLQELRNSLLPKLMSGEIRVPCEEAV